MKHFIWTIFGCLFLGFFTGCDFGSAPKTASVRVVTTPEGAEIYCNQTMREVSPTTIADLPVGKHLIKAKKAGYRAAVKSVTLTAGQTLPVEMNLEPIEGLVLFHATPEVVDVEVDGAFLGKTPLLVTDFPLGQHRVKFHKDRYIDKEIEVTVEDRLPRKIVISLDSDSGLMSFDSEPQGATVTIAGVSRGVTPCQIADVPTGTSTVQFRLAGYYPHEEEITLRAGESRELTAALRSIPGLLNVFSVPEGARIYLNNQYKGDSPLELKDIEPGAYRVRAELAGYAVGLQTVDVAADQSNVAEFQLLKNSGMLVVVTEPAGVEVFVDGTKRGVTKSGDSDLISVPMEIDLLEEGRHNVQLNKSGYEKKSGAITIEPNKIVNLQMALEKKFIPDTWVRIGDGPSDTRTGVLHERTPSGDIKLEVSRGVIVDYPASDIQEIRPLKRPE